MEPIFLDPSCKDAIWGGTRLKDEFGKKGGERVAESWELSCHPNGPSVIRGGEYAGEAFTRAYFVQAGGVERHFEGFPLKKLHLVGSEGVLASRGEFRRLPEEAQSAWMELSLRLCEIPELLSWSEHLLYIGQKIQEDRI